MHLLSARIGDSCNLGGYRSEFLRVFFLEGITKTGEKTSEIAEVFFLFGYETGFNLGK